MSDRLAVWMDGFDRPAGELDRLDDGNTAFRYSEAYLASGQMPLSLSLPMREPSYGDLEARAFFANLLPENAQFERILAREGLERGDVVGQLRILGADCAGAVSCLPVGAPPVKTPGSLADDYDILDDKQIARIVKSLAEIRRLPTEVLDPSPVAGVQSKIAVTLLPGNIFALPATACGCRPPTSSRFRRPVTRAKLGSRRRRRCWPRRLD